MTTYRTLNWKCAFASRLSIGVIGLIAVPAYADMKDIVSSNSQVGLQFVTTDVNYSETFANGGLADTEKGFVPGFGASISVMKDFLFEHDYFQLQYSQLNGNTNYVGSRAGVTGLVGPYTSGNYGSAIATSGAQLIDYSARFGKGFEVTKSLLVTPYLEVGRHEWKRTLSSSSSVPNVNISAGLNNGSTEDYTNYYYGVGAMAQISPIKSLVLTADAMVGNTFSSSMMVSGSSSLIAGVGVATGTSNGIYGLGNSVIYKLGASADYAFTEAVHGNVGVNYTAFNYGQSALAGVNSQAYEPNSKTNYLTLKVGLGYAF
jgi:hypothetical protein